MFFIGEIVGFAKAALDKVARQVAGSTT